MTLMELFLRFSSSNAIFECIDRATDYILHNHLYEFMDFFSLESKNGGIFHIFIGTTVSAIYQRLYA